MSNLEISFVIIEYRSLEDVGACVASIRENCKELDYEIVVSSNSCYPSVRQAELTKSSDGVRWVFNERNGGFAYGMNRGLSAATGRFRAIVNPDVKIQSGLAEMLAFMKANPQVGAIGPRTVNVDGVLQDTVRAYVSLQSLFLRTFKRVVGRKKALLETTMDYTKVQTVDWVSGAFILVREEVYRLTNGLSDDYFLYAEDLDWCTRIRKAGYEVVYFPKATIVYEGTRSARRSFKYAKIFLKSHLRYWCRFGFCFGYPKRKNIVW